jgi:hypothetical protein
LHLPRDRSSCLPRAPFSRRIREQDRPSPVESIYTTFVIKPNFILNPNRLGKPKKKKTRPLPKTIHNARGPERSRKHIQETAEVRRTRRNILYRTDKTEHANHKTSAKNKIETAQTLHPFPSPHFHRKPVANRGCWVVRYCFCSSPSNHAIYSVRRHHLLSFPLVSSSIFSTYRPFIFDRT